VKELFVKFVRLFLIHSGKRCARNLFHPEVIQFVPLSSEVLHQITQSFAPGKLTYEQGHKLSPAVERSEAAPYMVFASEGFKFMSLEKSHHLIKHCATMGHGSDLLVNIGLLAKSI
jgi:hypothetical protein